MRKITTIFFLILMLISVLPVEAVTEEGYGESASSLGQFVDSFEDSDNISVTVDVIRNATLEAMELNMSADGGFGFSDDFEANNLDKWTASNNWATGNAFEKTGTYGAQGWGSNSLLSKQLGVQLSENNIEFSYWIRPITYRSYAFTRDDAATVTYIYHRADTNTFYAYTGSPVAIASGCAEGNWYNVYIDDINFDTNTYDVHIYDAGMNLKGSRDDVAFPSPRSYISQVIFQAGTGSSGRAWLDDVNLTAGEAGPSEGYFTTTDYLDYANGSILVLMTNTTILENMVITVEFSEDNATWTLNDWDPIFGGFESIDLRELNWSSSCYLRYNLSTTNPELTPRVYQSRLITTQGDEAGDVVIQESDAPWIAIAIILMCVAYLLARYL